MRHKLIVRLLRMVRSESGAHMRSRIKRTAALRCIFWQGEYPISEPAGRHPDVLAYYDKQQLTELTQCHSQKGNLSNTTLPGPLEKLKVEVIIPIRSLLRLTLQRSAKNRDAWRSI